MVMEAPKRTLYDWPVRVGETKLCVTRAKPMSFRILSWVHANKRGWKYSTRLAKDAKTGPDETAFNVTRTE